MHSVLPALLFWSLTIWPVFGEFIMPWKIRTFKSTTLHPPVITATHKMLPSEGYMFFSPDGTPGFNVWRGPMIADNTGEPVWMGPQHHAFNFGVQEYKGEKVLVGWNGTLFREPVGRGNGEVLFWNKHYEVIQSVKLRGHFAELVAGRDYQSNIDFHEALITPSGTMLIIANNVTRTNLGLGGGPGKMWIVDSQVYEIDIATSKVLFSWKSLDHLEYLRPADSLWPIGSQGYDGSSQWRAWQYFHIDSVTPFHDGFVISSRFFSSAIGVNRKGQILWQLSGQRGGDFRRVGDIAGNSPFKYQHDIRIFDETFNEVGALKSFTMTLYDNHNTPIDRDYQPSSGKKYFVDLEKMEYHLLKRWMDPQRLLFSTALGNLQSLPNGNIILGGGQIPIIQEFGADGEAMSTYQFGWAMPLEGGPMERYMSAFPAHLSQSYRATKSLWTGCPLTRPAVTAIVYHGASKNLPNKYPPPSWYFTEIANLNPALVSTSTYVYASWNGATEVEEWELWGAKAGKVMRRLGTFKREGFETVMRVGRIMERVRVVPVLKEGTECRNLDSGVKRVLRWSSQEPEPGEESS